MTPLPPGIHDGIPEVDYHADRSALSVSSAKWLLPPSTPAVFKWRRDHPELIATTKAFSFGTAAHKSLLGLGPDIVYVNAKDWRTKAAQEKKKEVEAAGGVALLAEVEGVFEAMREKIAEHPIASRLLAPGTGHPEQSLFAKHESGLMVRGRLDWLPDPVPGRPFIICDYKTADSADPELFGRKAADYGYDMSSAWYRMLVMLLKIHRNPLFVFIVQEKNPPYEVNVIQLNAEANRIGAIKNARAIVTYDRCRIDGVWPGYPPEVAIAALPPWVTREYEDMQ